MISSKELILTYQQIKQNIAYNLHQQFKDMKQVIKMKIIAQ